MSHKPKRRLPPSQRAERRAPPPHDPNDPRFIAIHESGHAVAAVVLGFDLRGVDVKQRKFPDGGTSVGFTDCPVRGNIIGQPDQAMPYLIFALAGPVAEYGYNPRLGLMGEMDDDRKKAQKIAVLACCQPTEVRDDHDVISPADQAREKPLIDALMARGIHEAFVFCARHHPAIVAVANQLLQKTALTGAEVAAIVEANPPVEAEPME